MGQRSNGGWYVTQITIINYHNSKWEFPRYNFQANMNGVEGRRSVYVDQFSL